MSKIFRQLSALAGLLLVVGCDVPGESPSAARRPAAVPTQRPNFLVIVSDDQGIDWVNAYGESPISATTPNLDRLAAEGMLFRRAYAEPTCSPARATLLTGRHPSRYGIGMAIAGAEPFRLPASETLLPAVLKSGIAPYTAMALGKWHLNSQSLGGLDQPRAMGFDAYAGSYSGVWDYYRWQRIENGEPMWINEYATTVTASAAVHAIETLESPWFLMVAFNAPHAPFHAPPGALHSHKLDDESSEATLFSATVEALDTEVGRVLDTLTSQQRDNTFIFFVSDNGTMNQVMQPRESYGGKNSVRETGVRVPLMVAGPGVPAGTETDALVQTVDFLPTIAALARVAVPGHLEIDGESFADVLSDPSLDGRELIYTEQFLPNGFGPYDMHRQAIRDDRFKLIRDHASGDSLYDLRGSTREGEPLTPPFDPQAQAAWDRLTAGIDAI